MARSEKEKKSPADRVRGKRSVKPERKSKAVRKITRTNTVQSGDNSLPDIQNITRLEKQLIDSEVRYRRLFETAQDAILILEGDTGQILDANPFIKDMLGYTIEEMVGKNLWEIGLFKDTVASKDAYDELQRTGYIRYEHLPLKAKDGRYIDVEFVSSRYRVNSHVVFQCNIRDITNRKHLENRLIVISRLYTLLGSVNQAIFKIKNRDELFQSLCRTVVETGKFRMAWIGIIDNQSGRLQPAAWYGHEENYLNSISISIKEEPAAGRPTLMAISQGKIAVSNDIETELKLRPWREEALKRGYRSLAAIPLKIQNKVIGNLNIYSDTTGFFSDEERKLLAEIGDDISYALDSMEIEKDRQKAEKDLQKLDKLFEETQAITRLGGWEYDVGTGDTIWTKEVYRLYGVSEDYKPADIDSDISFYSTEDRTKIESAFKRAVETGEPYDLELKFNRAGGEQIWVRTLGKPVIENGKVVRITGNFMDITDRKQMEEKLKASEAKYHTIFNNAAEGIFQSTPEGEYVNVNPAFARIGGFNSPDEVINSVSDIQKQMYVQSEDRTRLMELLNSQDKVSGFECQVRRKDGSVIWISINIMAVRDENGEIKYLEGTIEDISQRKLAELALRESEERFSIAFHNSPVGITINHIKEGIFIVVNDAFLKMCGYEREELIGHSSTELQLVNVDDRDSFVNELKRRGKILNHELSLRTKTGEIRHILFSGQIITIGGDTYSLGLNMDITDRKHLEEDRLRIDKLQSVGILAGGIAHDFNNILTAILGNINLASLRLARGENVENLLKEAENASLRAKGLTQQLLTFARGGMPVKKTISIGNLIKETASFALRGSNVISQFSIPDDLWTVDADEGQISQVINNLVINARQAMPMGGDIAINAENITLNEEQTLGRRLPLITGDYVRITVIDHGIGIPAQYINQIFDPYYTTKQAGSGLGLANSFSIIHNHQGHIGVESVVNWGTTFYIYLPVSEKQTAADNSEKTSKRPAFTGRILVMDDEESIRDVAGAMLSHIGFTDVTLAVNGQQAVSIYQEAMTAGKPFAAVILDLTIPGGMGGRETIQKLHEIDPGVKAIVSSGYSGEDIIAEYQKYGFKGMVSKPYTLEQLSDVLGRVIAGDSTSA